jgi:hypothetical protein
LNPWLEVEVFLDVLDIGSLEGLLLWAHMLFGLVATLEEVILELHM